MQRVRTVCVSASACLRLGSLLFAVACVSGSPARAGDSLLADNSAGRPGSSGRSRERAPVGCLYAAALPGVNAA